MKLDEVVSKIKKPLFYAIAFNYSKPHPSILYFIKVSRSFKPKISRHYTALKCNPQTAFTMQDLSKLTLWLVSHPQIYKVLTVTVSAGKLAHAKDINKYVRGNDLLAVQRCFFLHHLKKAMNIIPHKYHMNIVQAIKNNLRKIPSKAEHDSH